MGEPTPVPAPWPPEVGRLRDRVRQHDEFRRYRVSVDYQDTDAARDAAAADAIVDLVAERDALRAEVALLRRMAEDRQRAIGALRRVHGTASNQTEWPDFVEDLWAEGEASDSPLFPIEEPAPEAEPVHDGDTSPRCPTCGSHHPAAPLTGRWWPDTPLRSGWCPDPWHDRGTR